MSNGLPAEPGKEGSTVHGGLGATKGNSRSPLPILPQPNIAKLSQKLRSRIVALPQQKTAIWPLPPPFPWGSIPAHPPSEPGLRKIGIPLRNAKSTLLRRTQNFPSCPRDGSADSKCQQKSDRRCYANGRSQNKKAAHD